MYLEFSTSRLTAICYGWLNIETVFGFVSTSKLMELRMKANELFDLINIEMVFGFVFLHSFQSFFPLLDAFTVFCQVLCLSQ